MTDQEVIETLARREGWKYEEDATHDVDWNRRFNSTPICVTSPNGKRCWRWQGAEKAERGFQYEPFYLRSRDALAPVLAGLSDDEWQHLNELLWKNMTHQQALNVSRYVLTIPPRDLAHAIAEAIGTSHNAPLDNPRQPEYHGK